MDRLSVSRISLYGVGENAYFFNGQLNILAKKRELSLMIDGGRSSEGNIIKLAQKAVKRIK